jgi:hypothetical protein
LRDWSDRFADYILTILSSIVSSLFGTVPVGVFPANFRGQLTSIVTEAYEWNSSVKSTFKSLDFHPALFTSADGFDAASMTLYLDHKPDQVPPKIIAAVSMALASTEWVSSGADAREEIVWQTRGEVLTEGFFG